MPRMSIDDLERKGYMPDGTRIKPVADTPSSRSAASRESDLHGDILDYCRQRGWAVVHSRMDRPSTSGIGTPDFVIALPEGRTVWVEAKASGGKLSTPQAAWLARLRALGHEAFVVHSMEAFKGCM